MVVDDEVHLPMRAGVHWGHHLVPCQDGGIVAQLSLYRRGYKIVI